MNALVNILGKQYKIKKGDLIRVPFIDKQFIFKRYWNHIFILNIQTISVLLMIITAIALSIIYNGILDGKSRRLRFFHYRFRFFDLRPRLEYSHALDSLALRSRVS